MTPYEIDKHESKICRKCPRRKMDFLPAVAGMSNKIMFVGEAPTKIEIDRRKMFTGGGGSVLTDVLSDLRWDQEDIYFTNAIRCFDPAKKPSQDTKALEQCRKHLIKEIARVKPRYVVTMGEPAVRQIQGLRGIMANRGKHREVTVGNVTFQTMATIHPNFVFHDPGKKGLFAQDLRLAKRLYKNPNWKPKPRHYVICKTFKKVKRFFREVSKVKFLATDTETSGYNYHKKKLVASAFDFRQGHLLCLSFSWKSRTAWVIPLVKLKAKPMWTMKQMTFILKSLKELYERLDLLSTGHNFKFDQRFLSRLGTNAARMGDWIEYPRYKKEARALWPNFDVDVYKMGLFTKKKKMGVRDTMLMQHLIDENATKGLKDLVHIHTDQGDYEAEVFAAYEKMGADKQAGIRAKGGRHAAFKTHNSDKK